MRWLIMAGIFCSISNVSFAAVTQRMSLHVSFRGITLDGSKYGSLPDIEQDIALVLKPVWDGSLWGRNEVSDENDKKIKTTVSIDVSAVPDTKHLCSKDGKQFVYETELFEALFDRSNGVLVGSSSSHIAGCKNMMKSEDFILRGNNSYQGIGYDFENTFSGFNIISSN